jgi:hypothetical protein
MKQELAVHLRVHRGKELTFNSKGESTNENHPVVLIYDTPEWVNYLKHLMPNGIIKAEVKKVLDLTKINEGKIKSDVDYYQEVADTSAIQAEVDKYLIPAEARLTPEQEQIKELKERLDALTGKGQASTAVSGPSVEDKAATEQAKADKKAATEKYFALYGKNPAPVWTLEIINQKIAEFKSAK